MFDWECTSQLAMDSMNFSFVLRQYLAPFICSPGKAPPTADIVNSEAFQKKKEVKKRPCGMPTMPPRPGAINTCGRLVSFFLTASIPSIVWRIFIGHEDKARVIPESKTREVACDRRENRKMASGTVPTDLKGKSRTFGCVTSDDACLSIVVN